MNSNEGKGLDKKVSQNPHETPAPCAIVCTRSGRFNYPPADEMRGISHALGVYLAIRDNIQFDIEGTK